MRYLWSTLKVKDLDRSVKFYETAAGLTVIRRITDGPGIAFLGNGAEGETLIELIQKSEDGEGCGSCPVSLGFQADCLDDQLRLMDKLGIEIESGPISPNPGIRFFFVKDPDGFLIQFAENQPRQQD